MEEKSLGCVQKGGLAPVVDVLDYGDVIAKNKSNWIDFNAGEILDGVDVDEKFFDYCIDVANGKETRNEINGYSEISIFKDGVTL